MTEVWTKEDYSGKEFNKILVIAITKNNNEAGQTFEDAVVDALKKKGITAVILIMAASLIILRRITGKKNRIFWKLNYLKPTLQMRKKLQYGLVNLQLLIRHRFTMGRKIMLLYW
jgi:hypothetical protein